MPHDEMPPSRQRKLVHRREHGYSPRFLTFPCYRQLPLLGTVPLRNVIIDCLREARDGGLAGLKSGAEREVRTLRRDGHEMIGRGQPFHLIAYVIMPEHAHLMVCPGHERGHVDEDGRWQQTEPVQWGPIATSIKVAAAKRIIFRWKQLRAPILSQLLMSDGRYRFWQRGPGFDRNVRTDGELEKEIRYIHRNPVEYGLVGAPTEWAWSSALWWANRHHGREQHPDDLPCDLPPGDPRAWVHWAGFL